MSPDIPSEKPTTEPVIGSNGLAKIRFNDIATDLDLNAPTIGPVIPGYTDVPGYLIEGTTKWGDELVMAMMAYYGLSENIWDVFTIIWVGKGPWGSNFEKIYIMVI